MLPVAVHFQKEMFNLNKSRDLHLQRVMNTFLGFCAELSGLALYYYSLSIIRSCTRQIFRRLLNPPYQFEIPCWQMQRDGEGSHSQAKTRLPDFQSLFCKIPSRHKSLQIHPCAFESDPSSTISCHVTQYLEGFFFIRVNQIHSVGSGAILIMVKTVPRTIFRTEAERCNLLRV